MSGDAVLQLALRTKEVETLRTFAAGVTPDSVLKSAFDGSSSYNAFSKDGNLLAVTDREGLDMYDLTVSPPKLQCRITQPSISALTFSPLGSLLLTWHRRKPEDLEPNLCIWSTADGSLRAAFHQKVYAAETWPPLRWTADEKLCTKIGSDEVQLFDGAFPTTSPMQKIAANGVQQVFVGPPAGEGKYTFVTFTPRNKNKPGSVVVWAYPKLSEPAAAKTLQADGCVVQFAPDGSQLLVEMSTSSSETSYYGDSRLFLISRDGRVNTAITPPKEGPTHDFAWSPNSDCFVVIAGRTPPIATLFNKHGAPQFTFGAAAHNTVRISPNGRIAVLAGFGNMAGNMWFWDLKKQKLLGPMVSAPCTVHAEWSPDSRYFLTATTRPRLQVDNGYRVWDYHARCVSNQPFDYLYHAEWRPRRKELFAATDRAPSPAPPADSLDTSSTTSVAGSPLPLSSPAASVGAFSATSSVANSAAGSAASGMKQPVKAAGAYRPPGARAAAMGSLGSYASADAAAAIMKEAYVPAGRVAGATHVAGAGPNAGRSAAGAGGAGSRLPVGAAVPLGGAPADSNKPKRRRNKKKNAGDAAGAGDGEDGDDAGADEDASGAAAAVADAPVAAVASAPAAAQVENDRSDVPDSELSADDKKKLAKKLQKKVKEIAELKATAASGAVLNADQAGKVAAEAELVARIAALGI